jgi:hypothetical protein
MKGIFGLDMAMSRFRWTILGLCFCALAGPVSAQTATAPPPLRVRIPFEAAWNGMREVLTERKLAVESEDRGQGRIVTAYREYISGPLTQSYLSKIGQSQWLGGGQWLRAEYQFEVQVQFVEAAETVVAVWANIRALNRDFLGKETWVEVPSNGNREEDLLTDFGKLLFGELFELDRPRKGYWERDPGPLPPTGERSPTAPGPGRP